MVTSRSFDKKRVVDVRPDVKGRAATGRWPAGSVPANLSEGHGRSGRDRMHHWRIAYASAKEVDSHLRLLAQAGAVDVVGVTSALQSFDEVRAMTWRLLHPKS